MTYCSSCAIAQTSKVLSHCSSTTRDQGYIVRKKKPRTYLPYSKGKVLEGGYITCLQHVFVKLYVLYYIIYYMICYMLNYKIYIYIYTCIEPCVPIKLIFTHFLGANWRINCPSGRAKSGFLSLVHLGRSSNISSNAASQLDHVVTLW